MDILHHVLQNLEKAYSPPNKLTRAGPESSVVVLTALRLYSLGLDYAPLMRGSKASRKPSPRKLKANTVNTNAMAGTKTSCG